MKTHTYRAILGVLCVKIKLQDIYHICSRD